MADSHELLGRGDGDISENSALNNQLEDFERELRAGHLPSVREALGSIPTTAKRKESWDREDRQGKKTDDVWERGSKVAHRQGGVQRPGSVLTRPLPTAGPLQVLSSSLRLCFKACDSGYFWDPNGRSSLTRTGHAPCARPSVVSVGSHKRPRCRVNRPLNIPHHPSIRATPCLISLVPAREEFLCQVTGLFFSHLFMFAVLGSDPGPGIY